MDFEMKYAALLILSLLSTRALAAGTCGEVFGVSLPCWREYIGKDFAGRSEGNETLPMFPFAKRENGCSIPGFRPGDLDDLSFSVPFFSFRASFRDACNAHDRCYYSPATLAHKCNEKFHDDLSRACEKGFNDSLGDITSAPGAVLLPLCYAKVEAVWLPVKTLEDGVHDEAQKHTGHYLIRAWNEATRTLQAIVRDVIGGLATEESKYREFDSCLSAQEGKEFEEMDSCGSEGPQEAIRIAVTEFQSNRAMLENQESLMVEIANQLIFQVPCLQAIGFSLPDVPIPETPERPRLRTDYFASLKPQLSSYSDEEIAWFKSLFPKALAEHQLDGELEALENLMR